jgi:hypothetical protein
VGGGRVGNASGVTPQALETTIIAAKNNAIWATRISIIISPQAILYLQITAWSKFSLLTMGRHLKAFGFFLTVPNGFTHHNHMRRGAIYCHRRIMQAAPANYQNFSTSIRT